MGVAVLGLSNPGAGVQLKTPLPPACNWILSLMQISESLNGRIIGGLSIILMAFCIVSRQPLLSLTINVAFFVPIEGYVKTGFCNIELSLEVEGSPKSQFHLFTTPNTEVDLSVNEVGRFTHTPVLLKSGTNPGYTLTTDVVESVHD